MDILGQPNARVNFKKADSGNKEFAFMKAHELNNIEKLIKVKCDFCNGDGQYLVPSPFTKEVMSCPRCKGYGHYYNKNIWRTGKNTRQQLIVETDNTDKENLTLIVGHLNRLFGYKFNALKTAHGYHIIGEHLYPVEELNHKLIPSPQWYFANCCVLNNAMAHSKTDFRQYEPFMEKIFKMDTELREYQGCSDYKTLFTDAMKKSGLLDCVGDFDILYTVLSLKYGKSTLRISKKHKDDKYEEVII